LILLKKAKFEKRNKTANCYCIFKRRQASDRKVIQAIFNELSNDSQSRVRPGNEKSPKRLKSSQAREKATFSTESIDTRHSILIPGFPPPTLC